MQSALKDVRLLVRRVQEKNMESHLRTNVPLHPHTQSVEAAESMRLSRGIFPCIHNSARAHCGHALAGLPAVSAALLLQIYSQSMYNCLSVV